VSLVGIELLTIDARIVIASVDTYLRFAEATNRLDLYEKGGKDLMDVVGGGSESGASKKTTGAVKGVKKALTGGDDNERRPAKKSTQRTRGRKSLDAAAVRAWALSEGYEIGDRGRIPASIVDAFTAKK